jgi:hypothetical protein
MGILFCVVSAISTIAVEISGRLIKARFGGVSPTSLGFGAPNGPRVPQIGQFIRLDFGEFGRT